MLDAAIAVLIFAVVAGVLGFPELAGAASLIAKIIFAVFLVVFGFCLLFGRRVRA